MALLFLESFEGYGGTSAHTARKYLAAITLSNTRARTGTWSATTYVARSIAPATKTIIAQVAVYYVGTANTAGSAVLGLSSTGDFLNYPQWGVRLTNDQKITMNRGNSTVLETSGICLNLNQWNSIEAKVLCANSGTWAVKVNGVQVLAGSDDTQAQGSDEIGSFYSAPGNSQYLDDLMVMDSSGSRLNDFIGDRRIGCIFPEDGNGSNVGLSCSGGTDHGTLVNDAPADDDSTYVYASTAALKDTYTFQDISAVTVDAVQLTMTVRKTDVGTKTICGVARTGGADHDGTTQAVGTTSYTQLQQIWEDNPAGSPTDPWSVADVNAAEFGIKIVE